MKRNRLQTLTGYLVPASLVQEAIKNNQNIAVVCYFKADDSITLKTVADIVRARKECGEDPTPKDLPYPSFRMEPFTYQPKGKSFSAWCEFIPDDYIFAEEKEKGFWMSGENPDGEFKASIRRHYADGDDADRRLVITGPGAVQAGKDFFPEIFKMDDIYWSPIENIFIDPSGSIHFLDCYNPEVYVKPVAKFLHKYLNDKQVFLTWKDEPIGDKPHGFDLGFIFMTDDNGKPTGKLFSFTATSLGRLNPEVHLHYGEWDRKIVYRDDLNLPQKHSELVAFHDCLKKASFDKLTYPIGVVLLELLSLLADNEDHSVLLHKEDSYEVRDCFTLIFEYFDQNTIPTVWADLLKDKIKVDKPIISANDFRRWTGIDEIPYKVPIIVVPYRLFVFLMNCREQKYFEDTDVVILSDYSEEYPALKNVDLHNSYFLPKGRVLVKVNKMDLSKTRLYPVEQIDTSANCSMLFLESPHLTTLGDVEKGVTYVKETFADDSRSVYAGGIRK